MKTWKETAPNASDVNKFVRCNRCKNVHTCGERLCKPDYKRGGSDIVCPKCECKVHIAFTFNDYKKAVKKESNHYQLLKGEDFNEAFLKAAYDKGQSPTECCNSMVEVF